MFRPYALSRIKRTIVTVACLKKFRIKIIKQKIEISLLAMNTPRHF